MHYVPGPAFHSCTPQAGAIPWDPLRFRLQPAAHLQRLVVDHQHVHTPSCSNRSEPSSLHSAYSFTSRPPSSPSAPICLLQVFCILLVGYMIEPLLTRVYMVNVIAAGEKVLATLRMELFRMLLMQKIEFFDRNSATALQSLISVELDTVRTFIFK